jgi:alpha-amylase/alpha-mannosidase (GH57 family)
MTSHPLYVAFIWHQHQPLYRSTLSGRYLMPWVRLHGTKDYLDLPMLLERYPRLRQTFNLVPSLILQIEDYASGQAMDPWLEVALKSADALDPLERRFVVERFFDANWDNLIAPYPRYLQLLEERQQKGVSWCLSNWGEAEYEDLMAWHNLCWFDPIFQEEDPEVRRWIARDQGFTVEDRRAIYAKQRELLGRIVEKHRALQETGQIEVTTTPYTHPILPLLADSESARVAHPHLHLPRSRYRWGQDMRIHLQKAKQNYLDRFGVAPRGLWPSEQSVSPAVIPEVAKAGFRWLVSDEGVLGWTLNHFFDRDDYGHIQNPDLLYRPYRVETAHGEVAMVFRDRRLSDLVGFEYARRPAEEAARDLIEQLEAISRRLKAQKAAGPHLVTIALDGENCWEHYHLDGKPFLECLYTLLSRHRALRLVTVSDYLDQFRPERELPLAAVHSGSWINADFTTWIGDPVKNRAWELLAQARQVLEGHPRASEATWEALWAAEGSDWFWWFGYGHTSAQDALFDQLFREHLQAIYRNLGEAVPAPLLAPLEEHDRPGRIVPKDIIQPVIDGTGGDREWERAGLVDLGGERGTMHQATGAQRLFYGMDYVNFYLRLDPGAVKPQTVLLFWYYPGQVNYTSPIRLAGLPDGSPANYRFRHQLEVNLALGRVVLREAGEFGGWADRPTKTHFAAHQTLELSVPWADLGVGSGAHPHCLVVLARDGRYEAHYPKAGPLDVKLP